MQRHTLSVRRRPAGQQAFGKRKRRSLMAAGRNTFNITEINSGHRYLVDTGAQLSVLPATDWVVEVTRVTD